LRPIAGALGNEIAHPPMMGGNRHAPYSADDVVMPMQVHGGLDLNGIFPR
jgi:hypothetical protein